MYASIYLFRVPRGRLESFLRIRRQAAEIELEHGALEMRRSSPRILSRNTGWLGLMKRFRFVRKRS
jgi:hypothetical protein